MDTPITLSPTDQNQWWDRQQSPWKEWLIRLSLEERQSLALGEELYHQHWALIKELHSPEGINWIPLSHHLFITANKGGQAWMKWGLGNVWRFQCSFLIKKVGNFSTSRAGWSLRHLATVCCSNLHLDMGLGWVKRLRHWGDYIVIPNEPSQWPWFPWSVPLRPLW